MAEVSSISISTISIISVSRRPGWTLKSGDWRTKLVSTEILEHVHRPYQPIYYVPTQYILTTAYLPITYYILLWLYSLCIWAVLRVSWLPFQWRISQMHPWKSQLIVHCSVVVNCLIIICIISCTFIIIEMIGIKTIRMQKC